MMHTPKQQGTKGLDLIEAAIKGLLFNTLAHLHTHQMPIWQHPRTDNHLEGRLHTRRIRH